MNRFLALICFAVVLVSAAGARAQSLDVTWNTIDCGGGVSSRNAITISGCIGQSDSGEVVMSGGGFTLVSGFFGDVEDEVACPADFDGDGFVTGLDFDAYTSAFESGDPSSDFDGDGFVTGLDFDAYVGAFEEGC